MKGFIPYTRDTDQVQPYEYLPCSAMKPEVGMAMIMSSGNLAKCGVAVKPQYICMMEGKETVEAGTLIPVIRVKDDMVFETTASVAINAVKLGDKVTLASDAKQITATTTSGVAELVAIDGVVAGSTVKVRFA